MVCYCCCNLPDWPKLKLLVSKSNFIHSLIPSGTSDRKAGELYPIFVRRRYIPYGYWSWTLCDLQWSVTPAQSLHAVTSSFWKRGCIYCVCVHVAMTSSLARRIAMPPTLNGFPRTKRASYVS